jgi:hypothetical protein
MPSPVVDPALLELLRATPGCGKATPGFEAQWPNGHSVAEHWIGCDACLTLLAAAVEEQTIARCRKAQEEARKKTGWNQTDAVSVCDALPRQWGPG